MEAARATENSVSLNLSGALALHENGYDNRHKKHPDRNTKVFFYTRFRLNPPRNVRNVFVTYNA